MTITACSHTPLFVAPLGLRTRRPPSRRLHRHPLCNLSDDNDGSNDGSRDTDNTDNNNPPPISANWREFRAGLVAGSTANHEKAKQNAYRTGHWAHPLSLPETGCFLASHPAYYQRRARYLTQSVVFLTHYDPAEGATGLVLNRPLAVDSQQLEAEGALGRGFSLSKTPFASQPIYIGGPHSLQKGVLSVVHSDAQVAGHKPLDNVFVCDLAYYLSAAPSTTPPPARLFAGCLRWSPGALEAEVDEGSWFCVAASEKFALEHCIQLPKPLWVEIMQAQGGTFERIANQVYNRDKPQDKSN